MTKSINEYLARLKTELTGCDPATIQDALSDAEEYLNSEVAALNRANPGLSAADAFAEVLEKYGSPEEVAAGYREVESRTRPFLARHQEKQRNDRPFMNRFVGILVEPRAWAALLYFILSLGTGITYFTWTVTGISVSLGLIVLIIGLPLMALFLLSVRGLSIVEGSIVQGLLGVRMPRRPPYSGPQLTLWVRFKNLIKDRYTWLSIIYMLIMLPLGITYFTLFVTLISVSFYLLARPLFELVFGFAFFNTDVAYFTPGWAMPLVMLGGALLFIGTMHLAKGLGKVQGALARALLVRL